MTRGKGFWIIMLERVHVRMIGDKEALFECFCHFSEIIRDPIRGNKEGWDAFDGSAFAPYGCLPEVVRGGMVEKIVRPFAFGCSDSPTEGLDGGFVGKTRARADCSKCSIALWVPPADATRVRCFASGKDLGGGRVHINMELKGSMGKGRDIRDRRGGDRSEEFEP